MHRRSEEIPVISAQTIQVQKMLGAGGYGVVHKAQHSEWGTVAYKKLYAQHIKERDLCALKHEAEVQWKLQHPNIVTILALIFEPENYGVVLEFIDYGEVFDYIKDHNPDFKFKISIVYDVCLAMCYLHSLSPPMIHGDLKVENILLDGNLRSKICDFGFSQWKQYSQSHSSESVRLGTVTHVPPELWRDSRLRKDETFDVYGYGICIWEIITAENPFKGERAELIKEWVLDNQRPDLNLIPPDIPENIIRLMKSCWSQQKSDRPMFSKIKITLEDETSKYHMVKVLLGGITCVPKLGVPGRVVIYGSSAIPILTGVNEEDVLMTATQFNKGRVVVISHDAYGTGFTLASSSEETELTKLQKNIKLWVSSGTFDGDECILDINHGIDEDKLNSHKILVWANGSRPAGIPTTDVLKFIWNGGGFVHCQCPWGWLQLNPGKKLKDMPYWDVLLSAGGVGYDEGYIEGDESGFLVEKYTVQDAYAVQNQYF